MENKGKKVFPKACHPEIAEPLHRATKVSLTAFSECMSLDDS